MKRLFLTILVSVFVSVVFCSFCFASDYFLRKYGSTDPIPFHIYETDGTDLKTDATFAAGDVKIMKDEGAEANVTNLPVDEGQGYSWTPASGELDAARVVIYLVDQGTKAWLDKKLTIDTYGHASAQHPYIGALDTAIPGSPTADSINERIKTMDDSHFHSGY